jgi:tetratricopeptide (TPR) repeat protein
MRKRETQGCQSARRLEHLAPNQSFVRRKALPGHDETDILRVMNNLASAYANMGKLDRSVPLFEETLRLARKELGPDHPHTLKTTVNLAASYRDSKRLAEAIALMEEAVERARQLPGGIPSDMKWAPAVLGLMYDLDAQFTKAEPLHRSAVEQYRKQFGADDPETAAALAVLGLNLLKQQKFIEAEPVLRESLAIRTKKLPDDLRIFNSQSLLGGALLGQKKYADAEPLLVNCYKGMKQREDKIAAEGKIRLTEALQRLVQLYEAAGKSDAAAKWRRELEAAEAAAKP